LRLGGVDDCTAGVAIGRSRSASKLRNLALLTTQGLPSSSRG
jgi:hypothetical protein